MSEPGLSLLTRAFRGLMQKLGYFRLGGYSTGIAKAGDRPIRAHGLPRPKIRMTQGIHLKWHGSHSGVWGLRLQ